MGLISRTLVKKPAAHHDGVLESGPSPIDPHAPLGPEHEKLRSLQQHPLPTGICLQYAAIEQHVRIGILQHGGGAAFDTTFRKTILAGPSGSGIVRPLSHYLQTRVWWLFHYLADS